MRGFTPKPADTIASVTGLRTEFGRDDQRQRNRTDRTEPMTKPTIGFIGLGLMGGAMVQHLIDLNYRLTVIANRSRGNVDAAVARGAIEVDTSRAVAEASDIIALCMDASDSVEARMRGADGVLSGLKPGAIVIDFGTSLPDSTRKLAAETAAAGGTLLDAPMGRTPTHARAGKVNIMCSGDREAFERARGVLQDLAENVFHLGDIGTGHTIKLINNFFAMTVATAMSEAFAMADASGVERTALHDVMSAGPLHSGMMDFITAYAVHGDPSQLAFAIKNAAKDVGYYARMAREAGFDSPLSGGTLAALTHARDTGHGEDLVPQLVDLFTAKGR